MRDTARTTGGFAAMSLDQMAARSGGPAAHMRDPQQPQPRRFQGYTSVEPVVLQHIEFPKPPRERAEESRVATNVLVDAQAQAEQIVADARTAARTMLAQARDVIAGEREQAIQRGHAEGRAEGVAQADAEMSGLVQTCERIALEVANERARALELYEPDVVELAIAVASRIVNASLDVSPELVVEACRGAMRKAFHRENLQVLAHPEDLARLRAAGPQLASELGGVEHLDFVEERRMTPGSVVVRTPAGEIDGTISGKASKIEDALREGLEQRRATRKALDAAPAPAPAPAPPHEA